MIFALKFAPKNVLSQKVFVNRARPSHFKTTREDQTENNGDPALAIPQIRRLILSTR